MLSDDSATLPGGEIAGAVKDLVEGARAPRKRDPLQKSIAVHGVDTVEYWVGGGGAGTLPPDIRAKLDP